MKNFYYTPRTDLALEIAEALENKEGFTQNTYDVLEDVKISHIRIMDSNGTRLLGKPIGNYITIESPYIKDNDRYYHNEIIVYLSKELKKLLDNLGIKKEDEVLVVGLGNPNVTPDTIGIYAKDKILITSHIYDNTDENFKSVYRPVRGIAPDVKGKTGIETASIIKGIIDTVPSIKAVIAIDALASRSINRVNTTIQITDTGIAPGSGVDNNRVELNYNYLNRPVIAIGVPTVIDIKTILYNFFENSYDSDEKFMHNKVNEIFDKEEYKSMLVTSTDVDEIVSRITNIIGNGVNLALHQGLNIDDINDFML